MQKEKKITQSEINKNEKTALIVGFGLISLVILITLLRGTGLFDPKNKSSEQISTQDVSKLSGILPFETIGSKELSKKIEDSKKNATFTMLDVRPFVAYIQEHIADSINLTPEEFPVGSKIDAHNLVVIIGEDNQDKNITTAIDKLKQENITNVVALAGGINSWKQIVGMTVTYGNPKSFVDQSKVSYLDPEQLNDAITKNVPVYILDVRSVEAFSKGHIAGARNIPFEDLEKRRREITERRIVVVGDNELQEFQASVQLYDMLLASPFVMRTGMPGWQNKKFAVVQ